MVNFITPAAVARKHSRVLALAGHFPRYLSRLGRFSARTRPVCLRLSGRRRKQTGRASSRGSR